MGIEKAIRYLPKNPDSIDLAVYNEQIGFAVLGGNINRQNTMKGLSEDVRIIDTIVCGISV